MLKCIIESILLTERPHFAEHCLRYIQVKLAVCFPVG
jgi:hypothetical protein